MTGENASESKPKDSVPMDQYGDAARGYVRTRTAATFATFFLGYLKPGMTLLDCGCGEGTITVDLAELVAPGQMVGLDISAEPLKLARQLAVERSVSNLRFEAGNVYALPFPDNSFDAVFAHALLGHLADKPKALDEMRRVLKPGGCCGVRMPDYDARIFEPQGPLMDQFWQLHDRTFVEMVGENCLGRQLSGLLHQTGFSGVTASASFESYGSAEGLLWIADIWSRFTVDSAFAEECRARGLADQHDLEQFGEAWRVWAREPNAFCAFAWCEAVGWKA